MKEKMIELLRDFPATIAGTGYDEALDDLAENIMAVVIEAHVAPLAKAAAIAEPTDMEQAIDDIFHSEFGSKLFNDFTVHGPKFNLGRYYYGARKRIVRGMIRGLIEGRLAETPRTVRDDSAETIFWRNQNGF